MSKIDLFEKITHWEFKAAESFNDNFSHDFINDVAWAYWLLGKGFTEHANEIILEIIAGETCIDQELLYHVFPENEPDGFNEENYLKNVLLMAEFLTSTPHYHAAVTQFLNEYPENKGHFKSKV